VGVLLVLVLRVSRETRFAQDDIRVSKDTALVKTAAHELPIKIPTANTKTPPTTT
jgi:hypothetical protein